MEHPQPLDQKAVDSSLAQLEQLAEGVVQTLEQLESASNSLERGGDAAIHAKVESLMSSFEEMHEMELPPQLTAPFGALDHIDKGENPDRYWKHVAETTVQVRVATLPLLFVWAPPAGLFLLPAQAPLFPSLRRADPLAAAQSVAQNQGRAAALHGFRQAVGSEFAKVSAANSAGGAAGGASGGATA